MTRLMPRPWSNLWKSRWEQVVALALFIVVCCWAVTTVGQKLSSHSAHPPEHRAK
jgi:hypothetical protein